MNTEKILTALLEVYCDQYQLELINIQITEVKDGEQSTNHTGTV